MNSENKNVLDFLNDTNNVNNTNIGNSTPTINNQKKFNFNKNKMLYIVIGVICVLIITTLLVGKLFNSDKKEGKKPILESKIELLDYKIDVDVSNEYEFTVNTTLTIDYLNSQGVSYHIPKLNDVDEIYDVKTDSSNNTETSRSEDDDNYYFIFGDDTDRFTGEVTHKISYKYKNWIALNSTKFTFLDDMSGQIIPNFELSITIPMEVIDYIELKFNRELDCTTNYNTTTCKAKNLEGYSKIDVTFMQKDQEQFQGLTPSNGYKTYLLPVSVISDNNLNDFKTGDYININSVGINGHNELTGEFIKNVRILEFKDYSNNSINPSNLKDLAFVAIEVNDEMTYLLSNVPYASSYLKLSIEKSDNSNPSKVIQSDITQFIDSMSY